jgi:acyl-CoA dehydrogenase
LLAWDIVGEIRELLAQRPSADEAITRALAAFDVMATVAREPRKVRQIKLGNSTGSEKQ